MTSSTSQKTIVPGENPFRLLPTPAISVFNPVQLEMPQRRFVPAKRKIALIPQSRWRGPFIGLVLIGLIGFLVGWPSLSGLFEPIAVSVKKPIARVPLKELTISSPFGFRWGRAHQGIDFAAPMGAPIYAASPGRVRYSGWEAGYGRSIVLEHSDGRLTRYAHCSKLLVKIGQDVMQGALIGKVGSTGHSTGPHLHFEVIVNGERKNPAWYYPLIAAALK